MLGLGFNCAEKGLTDVPALLRTKLLWFAQMPAPGCVPLGGLPAAPLVHGKEPAASCASPATLWLGLFQGSLFGTNLCNFLFLHSKRD